MVHENNPDKLSYKQKYLKDISVRRKSAINHRLFDGSASIPLYHNHHKAQHSGGFSLTKVCLTFLLCSLAACSGLLLLAQSHVEQLHGTVHPATVALSNTVVNLPPPHTEQQHHTVLEQELESSIPLNSEIHSVEEQPYVELRNSIEGEVTVEKQQLAAEVEEEVEAAAAADAHIAQEAAKNEVPLITSSILETGLPSLTTSTLVTPPHNNHRDSKAALMMPIRPSEDDYANLASFIAKPPPLNTTKLLSECITIIRFSVDGYMANAFPSDELLPISCVGGRNITGGIALSAIESLDTLILTRDFPRLRTVLIKLKAVWPTVLDGLHMHMRGQVSGLSHSRKNLGALSSSSLVVSSSSSSSGIDGGWDNRVPIVDLSQKALGGILSAHVLLEGIARKAGSSKFYNGELLKMAVQLADRILPAFDTPSGLPLSTVSLLLPQTDTLSVSSSSTLHFTRTLNSVSKTSGKGGGRRTNSNSMEKQSCSVCAIAPVLEFGLLSHLTNNQMYKQKAFKAMDAVFRVKSKAGFIPQTLDADTGKKPVNKEDISDPTIGTSATTFAATALKTYLMFGDSKYLHMYVSMFSSIIKYGARVAPVAADHHSALLYRRHHQIDNLSNTNTNSNNLTFIVDVDATKGTLAGTSALKKQGGLVWSGNAILSALAAFTGQLDIASKLYTSWIAGWDRYGWLPESFPADFKPTIKPLPYPGYSLRGELAEVSYYIMMSTSSSSSSNNNEGDGEMMMRENARQVGARIQKRIREHNRGVCGFASISDATTGQLGDSMPSGFVSSTLKWLFLMWAESVDDNNNRRGSVPNPKTIAQHFIANAAGHLYTPVEGSNDDLIAAATSDEPPESACYSICSPVGTVEQQQQQQQQEEKKEGGKGGVFGHLEMSEKGGKLLKIRRCMACRELSKKLMQMEGEALERRMATELRNQQQADEWQEIEG